MSCRLILTLLFVAISYTTQAQITLQQYRSSVIDYSHTLRRAEATTEGAEADMQLARKEMLPSLGVSSEANYDLRVGDKARAVSWSMRADVVQPIFYGGVIHATKERAEMLWNEALSREQSAMLDVIYDADVAYWTLSRAEIYYRAIEDYRSIVASLRDVAAHRFEEGYTSKSDLLQVESRLSDAEYQLSRAKQQWMQALHNFNVMRGGDPTDVISLAESILDTKYLPEREDVAEVVLSHPDYVAAIASREASRWAVKVARAAYLPNIGAGIYGLWYPKTPNVRGAGTRLDGGVTLTMTTPIYHFGERRQAMRSARSNLRRAELLAEDIADEIVLNESNGWTNLVSTLERVEAVRHNLNLATENLEISTYAYGEGLGTILDVLQAQLSWLQIYNNAIAAQYDYALAIAAYQYIIGESLDR
ncbi:MAG: TolC family protein [Alistipes sp.]|nr:TolC family protein [Alistipes sp.]